MNDDDINKRSEPRLTDEVAVFIEMQSSPEANPLDNLYLTKTLDISANGLKVLSDLPLPQKSIHQLCVEVAEARYYLVGQVAWQSKSEEGYALGFLLIESNQTQYSEWQEYVHKRTR